ncbi:DUF3857 domain-containing protein [Microscilla marina]|uniref:DUF3857 domain-containing protein n=1 Tax=Microscilla marina ATCC 23134 TaxID=313606 RepID=A1ZNH0_MICM2|nr:DUF3857 domain-containing protein [Microscilla marina]EAY28081.1 hypothetical protein M23134_02191 [Microscilla marina ATCC 23134]
MKYKVLFVLLWLALPALHAQQLSFAAKEVRQEIWGTPDADFTATAAPTKWSKESAVILGKSFRFEYGRKSGSQKIYKRIYLRERIQLIDKAAVEEYSEFTFKQIDHTWGDKLYFGIKVIKPSGVEKEIPLSESVKMQTQKGSETVSYQKLAIPDLVPGDVIDYYIFSKEILSAATTTQLPEMSILLAGDYPTVRQKVVLAIDPNIYLNVRALNNAPDFVYNEEEDLYLLRDGNREKLSKSLWFIEQRSVPTVRFQVFFSPQKFTGKKGKPKFSITPADVLNSMQEYPKKSKAAVDFYKKFKAYLKASNKRKLSNEEKLKEAYYFFRHQYQISMLEQAIVFQKVDLSRIKTDKDFVNIMAYWLNKYKFEYEVVVAVSRKIARLADWIIPQEASLLLKVNGKQSYYLQNPVLYDYFGEIRPELQGVQGYSLPLHKPHPQRKVSKIRLPLPGHPYHTTYYRTEVWMEEALQTLRIKQKTVLAGASRSGYQTLMVNPYEIIEESFPKYGTKIQSNNAKNQRIRQRMNEERNAGFKLTLKAEYNNELVALHQLNVIENGIWHHKPRLRFESEFVMPNLAKKVGQNYIFEAGRLIGKQVDIKILKKKRVYDVYMPYARSFKNELIIHLPKGYTIQGIDKLQKKVTNETGGFESSATLQAQRLVITTYKYYTRYYEPVTQWDKIRAFLKAAHQFTQQKLLLKKQ